MSVWAVLQHVPFEGPGLIAVQAHAHGIELDERHLYRGDALPSPQELAGLVVLGGPMGVGDTKQYQHLAGEIDLLARKGRVLAVQNIFISCSNQLGAVESGWTAAWFGAVPSVAKSPEEARTPSRYSGLADPVKLKLSFLNVPRF